jgi:heme-degrading monooxygenase HmoA
MRFKAGAAAQMADVIQEYDQIQIPGMVATYVFQTDADPQEYIVVTAFESKVAYLANAGSPEQHARYLKLRELLESDPQWNDGTIVQSVLARS